MAEKKIEFVYIKIETIDLGMMLELLTYEEIGKMFSAIYNYVENDTDPGELFSHKAGNSLLKAQLKKQAKAKEAYIKTSELRQEAGRKGGQAKAMNAKAKAAEEAEAADEEADGEEITTPATQKPKFKPPTLTQFKNYAKQLRKEEERDGWERGEMYDTEDYTVEALYDKLKGDGWKISGIPITCRDEWELACKCYLDASEDNLKDGTLLCQKEYKLLEFFVCIFDGFTSKKFHSVDLDSHDYSVLSDSMLTAKTAIEFFECSECCDDFTYWKMGKEHYYTLETALPVFLWFLEERERQGQDHIRKSSER